MTLFRENLVLRFLGQKEAKMSSKEVFQALWKIGTQTFSYFLDEVTALEVLNVG